MFRFIPTQIHAYLDYLMGILLIASPWLFGFAGTGAAAWTPVVLGVVLIVYSLITAYEVSIANVLPISTHLWLDALSGLLLLVSPWLFGFALVIWWPHVIFGLFEIGAAMFTKTNAKAHRPTTAPVTERQPNRASPADHRNRERERNEKQTRRDRSVTR